MAFEAKDGSKHTNHDSMKRANARFSSQAAPKKIMQGVGGAAAAGGDGMGDGGEAGGEGDPQDGAAMAQEHGPAVDIEIQHDPEGGRHSVHATHPDGHSHDSEHGSADAAHKYAADCAGVGSGMA